MFSKLPLSLLFWCIITISAYSQNLVNNGSFEDYSDCPTNFAQINKAKYWFSANDGLGGSSEYFNACANPSTWGVPDNGFAFLWARTGDGYAGTACYEYFSEYREYVEGTLKNAFIQGQQYCVSFYVSNSNKASSYAIDALGLYFTTDSLITYSAMVHQVTPQLSNDSLNVIFDSTNWVKISGTYIAQGGERFFTFGNFKPNSQTTAVNLNGYIEGGAYYLLDDVAVYECNAPVYAADAGGTKTICPGETITIGMPHYDEYLYRWYDTAGTLIDTNSSINVSPSSTTTYILWVEDFKYDITTDTVTVFIDENCSESPVVFIPNIFTPNLDGNNDVLYVRSLHIKELKFSVYNRWGEKVFESQNKNEGWDGNYKGQPCSPDVYVYHVAIVFEDGTEESRKGNVTLVR